MQVRERVVMTREFPRQLLEDAAVDLDVLEQLRADLRGLIAAERGPGYALDGPEQVTMMRMDVREVDGEPHLVEVADGDDGWTFARYRMVAWSLAPPIPARPASGYEA